MRRPFRPDRAAAAAALACLVAALAAGCVSGGAGAPAAAAPKSFSPVSGASRWITPMQFSGEEEAVVAVVDFDLSGRTLSMLYCAASFSPGPSGAMRLEALEPQVRVDTVRCLAQAMSGRKPASGAVAIAVLADGRPVGGGAEDTQPEMAGLLVRFDSDLRLAGIDSAYVAAGRDFSFAKAPQGGETERRRWD